MNICIEDIEVYILLFRHLLLLLLFKIYVCEIIHYIKNLISLPNQQNSTFYLSCN